VVPSAPAPPSNSRKVWRFLGVSALARELSSWPGRSVFGCTATIRSSQHGALAVPHSSTPRPRLSFPFGVLFAPFPVCSLCLQERLSLDDSVCAFSVLDRYLARNRPVCWNIGIDRDEDSELIVLQYYAGTRSLYIQEGRQDKGRKTAPPEPVPSDSVMSRRLLISGRLLISHVRTPPHLRTPPYSDNWIHS